jgi:hypothetical protein
MVESAWVGNVLVMEGNDVRQTAQHPRLIQLRHTSLESHKSLFQQEQCRFLDLMTDIASGVHRIHDLRKVSETGRDENCRENSGNDGDDEAESCRKCREEAN